MKSGRFGYADIKQYEKIRKLLVEIPERMRTLGTSDCTCDDRRQNSVKFPFSIMHLAAQHNDLFLSSALYGSQLHPPASLPPPGNELS
jgi:hypothetical protein